MTYLGYLGHGMRPLDMWAGLVVFSCLVGGGEGLQSPWEYVRDPVRELDLDSGVIPKEGSHFRLDTTLMRSLLEAGKCILPIHNGSLLHFSSKDTTNMTMHPTLAAKFPSFRTYHLKASGVPGVRGEISLTPHGFHAQLLSVFHGMIYIDPVRSSDLYVSYSHSENVQLVTNMGDTHSRSQHKCTGVHDTRKEDGDRHVHSLGLSTNIHTPTFARERVYTIALAANSQYCAFHGSTVSECLAAVTACVSRLNGIYKRDLAISFTMHASSDALICISCDQNTLANTASALLNQIQGYINLRLNGNELDSTGYDIGHVFSTGAGGQAGLGVVCHSSYKSKGVTGSHTPVNDAFWVDYVAHEIGHQFGGSHTWNGQRGSCATTDWKSTHAYEPGSGSTIMAYAGICSSDNIQSMSDPYFHLGTLSEIQTFVETSVTGTSCGTITASSNSMPTVTVGTASLSIPVNQPFVLTAGTSSDSETAHLIYAWDQIDLNNQAFLESPLDTAAPRFRSYLPTTSKSRFFPKLSLYQDHINAGASIRDEILPTAAGTMVFAVTVRDVFNPNHDAGYGFWDADRTSVTVTGVGPMSVTHPKQYTVWSQEKSGIIEWSVASTDSVSPSVDILLSVDNGVNWDYLIANRTANDGSYNFTTPCVGPSTYENCYVMIRSIPINDNYWFALSPKFRIATSNSECSVTPTDPPTTIPPIAGSTSHPTLSGPTKRPTLAPTPSHITKVEWITRFPSLSYSQVHSNSAMNSQFTTNFDSTVSSAAGRSPKIRYINRLNSGSDTGVVVDSHVDYDTAVEAASASAFANSLETNSGDVFSTANGFDFTTYGTPIVGNVTIGNLQSPTNLCASDTCHYIIWETWHANTAEVNVSASVNDQIIFFWMGDETIYLMPSLDSYNSCNLTAATKLTTIADERNSFFGYRILSQYSGQTLYFACGSSNDNPYHPSSTLCDSGLKAKVFVKSTSSYVSSGPGTRGVSFLLTTILPSILGSLVLALGISFIVIMCCRKARSGPDARKKRRQQLRTQHRQRMERLRRSQNIKQKYPTRRHYNQFHRSGSPSQPARTINRSQTRTAARSPTRTAARSQTRTAARSPQTRTAGRSSTQTAGRSPTRTTARSSQTRTAGRSPTQTAGRSPTGAAGRSQTRTAGRSPTQTAGRSPTGAAGRRQVPVVCGAVVTQPSNGNRHHRDQHHSSGERSKGRHHSSKRGKKRSKG